MIDQVLSIWQIHDRINLYLLNSLHDDALTGTASSKGRTVADQFAHIHNVRLMWLKASAPELLQGLDKLEKGSLTKQQLADALTASGAAIEALLKIGFEAGKIKGMKPYPMTFLGYIISHESHHRGQIVLSLKQSGHPVDKKIAFGLWEWGSR